MKYTKDLLRNIFQQKFNLENWKIFLKDFFQASELKVNAEKIANTSIEEQGYYLGVIDTDDNYRIGLFYFDIRDGIVTKKKVGLRRLVKSLINPKWGEFDAALVVFSNEENWRLSFISDIKGDNTAAKRYTYVFGNRDNCYNTTVGRFEELQQKGISYGNIKETFSVEALTKQFYQDLFEWYQWAVDKCNDNSFPTNNTIADGGRENIDVKIIRMITRLMFVWFIKQKELIPNNIFEISYLSKILKDFDPLSAEDGTYYNAILQNLFFATLNRSINDEEGNKRGFARVMSGKDLKTLYRYQDLFTIPEEEIIKIFEEVPFLNGGLFECLDKTRTLDGVEKAYYYDGFSRNEVKLPNGRYKYRAFIPNELFFKPEHGLFSILNRYNFTIEENTPNEQQVALDPELLGNVFENLLGAYNPETKETARNQSGSFYTPREIVNYMVDESLQSYLGKTSLVKSLFCDDFVKDPAYEGEYQIIAEQLKSIKVIDPACGSGAFPMGLLNRLVDLLQKIHTEESEYELKLAIIENCIYGIDIQSIASQITKLRFFISLICDCEKDVLKPNYGIPTLPNLETKFVAANSLIAKKKRASQGYLFEDPAIETIKKELSEIRHKHFSAKSASSKRRLRDEDQELRERLAQLLSDNKDFAPEDAKQLADWNPYDQNNVSPFFDPEWMFGITDGFDIIIGNPPYIQLQNNGGILASLYDSCGYNTFARTGDIYCLFYERGWQLLKQGGHLCYITSNKWMRAGYGEKIREFFVSKTNPKLLIDFSGIKIFESATVDTNILLFSNEKNNHETICAVTNKQNKESVKNLSVFVEQQHVVCNFIGDESWAILCPIEQSIKRKIESMGTPLKEWDINIYRGVLTGYNEAFVISTEKRNEILNNCQSEDEKQRTADLIRPILRGRDIKRYGNNWANLWLINTHNGIKGKLPRIKVEDFPSIKAHLDYFGERIMCRTDKGDTPYNLRNCAYLEDFSLPKIVYIEIMTDNWDEGYPFPCFSYDDMNAIVLNTGYIMSSYSIDVKYVLGILNSKLGRFLVKLYVSQLQSRQFRMLSQFVNKFPIAIDYEQMPNIIAIVTKILDSVKTKIPTKKLEDNLNQYIYAIYGLTPEEQQFIEDLEL